MREIKCVKNGHSVRFEVPKGKEPINHGKAKLREMFGKKPVKWEYEIIK